MSIDQGALHTVLPADADWLQSTANRDPVGTIDMTPTWTETVRICLVILELGNFEGKKIASQELERMGRILDDQVAISRDRKGGAL